MSTFLFFLAWTFCPRNLSSSGRYVWERDLGRPGRTTESVICSLVGFYTREEELTVLWENFFELLIIRGQSGQTLQVNDLLQRRISEPEHTHTHTEMFCQMTSSVSDRRKENFHFSLTSQPASAAHWCPHWSGLVGLWAASRSGSLAAERRTWFPAVGSERWCHLDSLWWWAACRGQTFRSPELPGYHRKFTLMNPSMEHFNHKWMKNPSRISD